MSRPKKKINVFKLFSILPLLLQAVAEAAGDVEAVTSDESEGGAKVTPEEAIELADSIYDRLKPVAKALAELLTA